MVTPQEIPTEPDAQIMGRIGIAVDACAGASIHVYLDDGRVFAYAIPYDTARAREHAVAIITKGYYHNDGAGECEFYPVHRILKVKVVGIDMPTDYPDEVRGI